MAGNWVALGRVILMAPGLWAWRKGSSCPVSRRWARSGEATIPVTLLTGGAVRPPACQERATAPGVVEALDRVPEVAHEVRPPELAVGEDVEAQVLLSRQGPADVAVLQLPEGLGVGPGTLAGGPEVGGRRKLPMWSARYRNAMAQAPSASAIFMRISAPRLAAGIPRNR